MPQSRRAPNTRKVAVVSSAVLALVLQVSVVARPASADDIDVAELQRLVDEAHAEFKEMKDGANANYIPILDEVDSELFGVAVVTVNGDVITAGEVDSAFSIQSVAKPFTMALVMEEQELQTVVDKIGVEPTGMPFNSIIAIELNDKRSINPLVNAGAIAAVSMLDAASPESRWAKILDGYSSFAGEELVLLEDVYISEAETNYRNRAIANLLFAYERLYCDPMEAVDVYTKQSSVGVTAKQLAMMGATLANGGVNPKTGERVLRAEYTDEVLAVMLMAGFYDQVGAWAYYAGLPAKTGVGGGIVAVVPGKMAIVGFSPRLNEAGNSVRALRAIHYIGTKLGTSLLLAQD